MPNVVSRNRRVMKPRNPPGASAEVKIDSLCGSAGLPGDAAPGWRPRSAGGMARMPSLIRLARVVRLLTLPETRGVIVAAARSKTYRDLPRRAVNDRAALVRDLRDPANARELVRSAARHPATRELADAGLNRLPGRYLPLGLAASRATHRILRRYVDPTTEVPDASAFGASRPMKHVTRKTRSAFFRGHARPSEPHGS